ncbi:MAG: hypothetical protein ACODAA_03270 [Gemmatimonadota bacterium]
MRLYILSARRMVRTFGTVALVGVGGLTTPAAGGAQEDPPEQDATEPPSVRCDAPEYRQFDFWVGEWEVRNPAGDLVGRNTIERILGGCALHESWTGTNGSTGESFNIYDARTGLWHQTWVDNSGRLLELDGGLEAGEMVLRGELETSDGGTTGQRITWTPADDGSVRQFWERSTDGGVTWTTIFDGTYRRVGEARDDAGS